MTSPILAAGNAAADASLEAGVIAAIIASFASLIASSLAWGSSRQARKAVEKQRSQDYRVRQLNELYGPIYMRRMESRRLRKQLPDAASAESGKLDWHLLDHIEEIKNETNSHRRHIVKAILDINEELRALIVGAAGLLETFPPPESFEKFLEHARTLKIHWDQGRNAEGVTYLPFPGEIDEDIAKAIQKLRSELK